MGHFVTIDATVREQYWFEKKSEKRFWFKGNKRKVLRDHCKAKYQYTNTSEITQTNCRLSTYWAFRRTFSTETRPLLLLLPLAFQNTAHLFEDGQHLQRTLNALLLLLNIELYCSQGRI